MVLCSVLVSCTPTKKFVRTSWSHYRIDGSPISSSIQVSVGQKFDVSEDISTEVYAGEYYGSISGETYSMIGSGLTWFPTESFGIWSACELLTNNNSMDVETDIHIGAEYEW